MTEIINLQCQDCMHRTNRYCKAYQASLDLINTSKCKRYKAKPSEVFKIKKKIKRRSENGNIRIR